MLAASGGTPKKRVLIVDDDHSALEAMELALGRDLHVSLARDIPTARETLEKQRTDLIILDVRLEGENGLDFLARLRETCDVPVLLISGYGSKEMVIAGLRARASDYLDKPFTATDLLEKARDLVTQGPRPSHVSERIRHFIQQHYMRDWTVETLARALHLSVRTMRQMFRRRYQRSVMDFLEEVRVTRARELLATTDLSVQKVAANVGFRDPNYFARVFHRHVGKCPRDFRSEQRRKSLHESPPST